MAFALTNFKAFGIRTEGSTRQHVNQVAQLYITAATSDVAMDLGTDAGTFWTAAQANATYGALASQALSVLQKIQNYVTGLMTVQSPALLNRIKVTSPAAATDYSLTISNQRPNITFDAANGDTSYVITLVWALHDGLEATVSDLGGAV